MHNYICSTSPAKAAAYAVFEFLHLDEVRSRLLKFDAPRQLILMHYCLLYVNIYKPNLKFEINVSDRYLKYRNNSDLEESAATEDSTRLMSCVVARTLICKVQTIFGLVGWLSEVDVNGAFKEEPGSFILYTSDSTANILMGPARFVNHDCNPNCSFSCVQQRVTLKAIKDIYPGQEITIAYPQNSFGVKNRECRCVSCEISRVNGFGLPIEHPTTDEDSDIGHLEKVQRKKRKSGRGLIRPLSHLQGSDGQSQISRPIDGNMSRQDSRPEVPPLMPETKATRKRRIHGHQGDLPEESIFKFTFEDDNALFAKTKKEWKLKVCEMLK